MIVKKTKQKSCCGKSQIKLEFDFALDKEHLKYFLNSNFIESKAYTSVGILYLEDDNLVIMGPFGSNRLQVKCKNANCDASVSIVETILQNIKK